MTRASAMRTCRHNTQVTLSQGYGFLWLETTTDSVGWLIIWTFFPLSWWWLLEIFKYFILFGWVCALEMSCVSGSRHFLLFFLENKRKDCQHASFQHSHLCYILQCFSYRSCAFGLWWEYASLQIHPWQKFFLKEHADFLLSHLLLKIHHKINVLSLCCLCMKKHSLK